ncbi:MAG TPA: hypothetical protein VFX12_00610 [Vicinamibacterales bacterium]|nr:hypothetical protein [Vicinamibacterales bacterium]
MKRLVAALAGALLLVVVPAVASAAQATPAKAPTKAATVRGTVSTVTADSLTITTAKSGDMTFAVDAKTRVVGKGMGTKSNAMKSEKKPTEITDFVNVGDTVSVRYGSMDGQNHATSVTVTRKASK